MQFAPEVQILILNAVVLGLAYIGIYPSLEQKTLGRLLVAETVLIVIVTTVVGALFWGTQTRFSLIIVDTNWFLFTFITYMIMDTPLGYWFIKKHNINIGADLDE